MISSNPNQDESNWQCDTYTLIVYMNFKSLAITPIFDKRDSYGPLELNSFIWHSRIYNGDVRTTSKRCVWIMLTIKKACRTFEKKKNLEKNLEKKQEIMKLIYKISQLGLLIFHTISRQVCSTTHFFQNF